MYRKYIKRPMDFVLALLAVIVFSWLFAIVAILVRIKLGSPIIFKQPRPGKDEKIFYMYKFRTMNDARDENGELLPDEMRLTRFGKLLRKSSLDELPEAFCILKGDMSIVGPRPLRVHYLPLYNEHQRRRHEVRPGLSGLAQVNGRNAITWEEKFDWDVKYVDNITFLGDVKIILLSVWKAFVKTENINADGDATVKPFLGTPVEHVNIEEVQVK